MNIINNTYQIPVIGCRYEKINICVFKTIKQAAINCQQDDNRENDEQIFFKKNDLIILIKELTKALNEINEE